MPPATIKLRQQTIRLCHPCNIGRLAGVHPSMRTLLILALSLGVAHADPPDALGTGAALVPGVLVGGAGHYVAGERDTAKTLFWLKTGGLGVLAASGLALGASGASRRVAPWAMPLIGAGFGSFVFSTIFDVYGTATGGTAGRAERRLPDLSLSVSWRAVDDPQFTYGHLTDLSATGRLGRWGLSLDGTLALDADNWRVRPRAAWRWFGDTADRTDGSFLDLYGRVGWQRYGEEGFAVLTPEAGLFGRLDLAHVGSTLRGAFVEGALGWAWEFNDYDLPGASLGEDVFDLLIMRAGFGLYLGRGGGEIQVFYDHRRDTYAGGLTGNGIAAGFFGYAGLEAAVALNDRWRVLGHAALGSARIAGLGLEHRFGGER